MMSKNTRIPRASLAISILDDDDYIEMVGTEKGCLAFALFAALILEAKVQGNHGVFDKSDIILCKQIKWEFDLFKLALEYLLNSNARWVIKNGTSGIAIRSFDKWNSGWGGTREGSGRPLKNQNDNQVNQAAQLDTDSDSDSDSDTYIDIKKISISKKSFKEYKPDFEIAWNAYECKGAKGDAAKEYDKAITLIKKRGEQLPNMWLLERTELYVKIFDAHNEKCYRKDYERWLSKKLFDFDEKALLETGDSKKIAQVNHDNVGERLAAETLDYIQKQREHTALAAAERAAAIASYRKDGET